MRKDKNKFLKKFYATALSLNYSFKISCSRTFQEVSLVHLMASPQNFAFLHLLGGSVFLYLVGLRFHDSFHVARPKTKLNRQKF